MANRRITFEVDQVKLFDALAKMGGDGSPLGNRIAAALLADSGIIDRIGMAVYGVTIVDEGSSEGVGQW